MNEPKAVATSSSTAVAPMSRAFFSGAIAGVVADSILHPVDTINLRIKVQTTPTPEYSGIVRSAMTIARNEGIRGWFGGLTTTMMASPVCASLYFGSYETIKSFALPLVPSQHAGLVYFLAGATSEALISTISVPAEVIKCRLQLGQNPRRATNGVNPRSMNYRGTFHAFQSILRTDGIRGLYTGYTACLSVDTMFSAFSFFFYETFTHTYMKKRERSSLSTTESLVLGSMAGGSAAFLTNPLDVLTVRLMTQGTSGRYRGVLDCIQQTIHQEGFSGFWKGATCRTSAIMPQMGICFGVYESIKQWYFQGELESFEFEI